MLGSPTETEELLTSPPSTHKTHFASSTGCHVSRQVNMQVRSFGSLIAQKKTGETLPVFLLPSVIFGFIYNM